MKLIKFAMLALIITLVVPGLAGAQEKTEKRHPSYTMTGRDNPPPDSPLNPNFVVAEESRLSESGFWRSPYIPESLVGVCVADITGDGRNEVIYASARNVYVARVDGQNLAQIARYAVPITENVVSLDTLDVNGDGQIEIIISGQDSNFNACSTILSLNGEELTPLARGIPWYLRVVGHPNGRFLAGQKSSTSRSSVFTGSVMRMKFDGSKVSSQGAVGLPPFINIYNFTIGRLGSSGTQMVAAIKWPTEHVFLFEGTNQAWESREEYGGTMNRLESAGSGSDTNNREYLPSRLLIADIDGDGQNELIVAKNDRGGIPFMSNQRGFTSGVMQAFKYSNMSLTPFFRTRTLPGPAIDYALADFNNNGTLDMVVAVVTEQKSGMMKEGRSVIVAYEISARAD